MKNTYIKNEDFYKKLTALYMNDAVIKKFTKMKADILEVSIPSYVWNKEDGKITIVYDKKTTDILKNIDRELKEYIEKHYPDLKNEIHS